MRFIVSGCTLLVDMTTRRSTSSLDELHARLRSHLALKRMTLLDLANRLGHPVSTLGSWLRGVGRPPADLVRRIERVLKVPAGALSQHEAPKEQE